MTKQIILLLTLMAVLLPAVLAAPQRDELGQNIVQADDWLSKLADGVILRPVSLSLDYGRHLT